MAEANLGTKVKDVEVEQSIFDASAKMDLGDIQILINRHSAGFDSFTSSLLGVYCVETKAKGNKFKTKLEYRGVKEEKVDNGREAAIIRHYAVVEYLEKLEGERTK